MLNKLHDTVLHAVQEVGSDKCEYPHRKLTQRELRLLDDIEMDIMERYDAEIEDGIEAILADNTPGQGAKAHRIDRLFYPKEVALTFKAFEVGQVDGFRLAFRLITRMLSGKVEEFHNVTPDNFPLILAGALTDDDQAAELIGKLVTGQM